MKDRPIQVGDMVITIKPIPCCGKGLIGYPFVVKGIYRAATLCGHCGAVSTETLAVAEDGYIYEMSRLKRLPPPDELETLVNKEEITA